MDELEQLRQRVQQLEKALAEVRQDVSSEMYKMRASLAPLKGFISTLLDDEKEEWYTREDRREFYTILNENIDNLSRLVYYLDFMKDIQANGLIMYWQAAVDVHYIAESVVARQQKRADKHNMALDFDPSQIFVETDPDKFEIILDNLIRNAIKYSPDGGEVRVSARLEPPRQDCSYDEMLLLQVKDQGLGLSKEEMLKVGVIFTTWKMGQRNKDTSGGLWLIKEIIMAHHGKMWLESEGHGQGVTVNIRIPVKQPRIEN